MSDTEISWSPGDLLYMMIPCLTNAILRLGHEAIAAITTMVWSPFRQPSLKVGSPKVKTPSSIDYHAFPQ